jgi:hypothetical protein
MKTPTFLALLKKVQCTSRAAAMSVCLSNMADAVHLSIRRKKEERKGTIAGVKK